MIHGYKHFEQMGCSRDLDHSNHLDHLPITNNLPVIWAREFWIWHRSFVLKIKASQGFDSDEFSLLAWVRLPLLWAFQRKTRAISAISFSFPSKTTCPLLESLLFDCLLKGSFSNHCHISVMMCDKTPEIQNLMKWKCFHGLLIS